jgi:chromosome segregation ATPase
MLNNNTEQQISALQKQLSKYRRQTLTLQDDVDSMKNVAETNESLRQEILKYVHSFVCSLSKYRSKAFIEIMLIEHLHDP